MLIVISHAYSRTNAGDGLLVDEAVQLVNEAFPGAEIRLISVAPSTFPEFPNALSPLAGREGSPNGAALVRTMLTRRPHPLVQDAIRQADLVVAVGGGYLRAGGPVAFAKAAMTHLSQLPPESASTPHVYLPQSIGPFPPVVWKTAMRRLRNAHAVFVRDDRSLSETRRYGIQSVRAPDLAAVAVAKSVVSGGANRAGNGEIGIVARSLGSDALRYDEQVKALAALTKGEILVQSSGRGNDDPSYYRSLGFQGEWRTLKEAIASDHDAPSLVISTRLHGSLQSILAGIPSIHLSYERKGWGAFEDLGIPQFVHNARAFDLARVSKQADDILSDPGEYWDAVRSALPHLRQSRELLVRTLREANGRHE